ERCNSGALAGDFKVHVALMILAPAMSVRMEYFPPSPTTRPMAIPAHGDLSGTPASIMAREPPQTVAIEEEPLDSRMSLTRRIAYGNSVSGGSRLCSARSAKAP